jgi:hypothetical protein
MTRAGILLRWAQEARERVARAFARSFDSLGHAEFLPFAVRSD